MANIEYIDPTQPPRVADPIRPPEIDFRSTPESRHFEAHAGLPLLTQAVQKRLVFGSCDGPRGLGRSIATVRPVLLI